MIRPGPINLSVKTPPHHLRRCDVSVTIQQTTHMGFTQLSMIMQFDVEVYLYIYTWNLNDPCFGWKRPCSGGLTFKNRGHLRSRYIYI